MLSASLCFLLPTGICRIAMRGVPVLRMVTSCTSPPVTDVALAAEVVVPRRSRRKRVLLERAVPEEVDVAAKSVSRALFQSALGVKKASHSTETCPGDENVAEEEKGTSWRSLGVGRKELCLQLTLPTGQSFRWKQTGPSQYTGVVGMHLVSVRQTADGDVHFRVHSVSAPVKDVEREIRGYFNLDTSLVEMWTRFTEADSRFAAVAPYMLGARLLRQAPVECVFQFICSSNNHLQRIASMVDYLSSHGPYLGSVNGIPFHAFPSLEQLATLSESELRNAGFGYRAKYIVGAVELLRQKADGGEHWLCSLRQQPLDEAVAALCSLPGIGPKVAACIALFSLDQHHAIPVDTHVWQIAVRYLLPELEGRKLTPKLHRDVSEAFVKRFGMYAGWAHTVLFIAELSSQQSLLPLHLRSQNGQKRAKKAAS